MPDWNEQKGIAITDATPTGDAGVKLNDNFERLRDEAPFHTSSDPTTTDDSTVGFFAGSQWFNTSSQTMFVCTDATASAAVWKSLFRRNAGSIILCPEDDGAVEIDNLKLDGNTLSSTDTNGPIIIAPNGNGAIQMDIGGDTRGNQAVDFQSSRVNSTEVASGHRSVISGGYSNTASGDRSSVGGGRYNIATGAHAIVAGGEDNEALSTHSTVSGGMSNVSNYVREVLGGGQTNEAFGTDTTICGGRDNNIESGSWSTIGGGRENLSTNSYSAISGGYQNEVTSLYGSIGGGSANLVAAWYAFIPGGQQALAAKRGQMAHASGMFSAVGDAQSCRYVLRRETTDASTASLGLDGSSSKANIPTDTTWVFHILLVARRTDADNESAAWEFKGCIDNNGGTTALVGSVTKTVLADDSSGTWDANVSANDTSDYLNITVNGEASKTIRWVATLTTTEVTG